MIEISPLIEQFLGGRRNLSDTEFVRHGSSPTESGVVRLGFVGQLPCRTTSVSDNFRVGQLPCRTTSMSDNFLHGGSISPINVQLWPHVCCQHRSTSSLCSSSPTTIIPCLVFLRPRKLSFCQTGGSLTSLLEAGIFF